MKLETYLITKQTFNQCGNYFLVSENYKHFFNKELSVNKLINYPI
jgi:hypothetical protein